MWCRSVGPRCAPGLAGLDGAMDAGALQVSLGVGACARAFRQGHGSAALARGDAITGTRQLAISDRDTAAGAAQCRGRTRTLSAFRYNPVQ